ncbi:MAG: hypothetical protein HYZ58_12580 [Acidobacteria bacterium]|nr:hypothetical protein [Acidobacteriota bacterium]
MRMPGPPSAFSSQLSALVLSALLAGPAGPGAAFGQANQPVYPAYDGFTRNPDGTVTLAFGYFNHNADPVTLPPGTNNQFAPDPLDRQQPTRFLPGQHRFQCVVVMGPDFDGKLRWTLSYGGTTTSTSEKMLQYSWELEEAGTREVMRGLDLKGAPRGVCLNRPPVVRVLGLAAGRGGRGLSVTLPEELRLFGSVEDEGLPREGTLSVAWKKISGPGTISFSNPTAARTRASFSAPGAYQLELSASDSQHESRVQVTVTVQPPPKD